MSVESMAIALHHSRATTAVARLVLIGICNHDGDGGAWPTIKTLAKYAGGVSDRTVQRAIGELEELGEIRVERNAGGTKNWQEHRRPNLYHVTLICPPECDRSKSHNTATHGVTPVSSRTDKKPHGVTPVSPGGVTPVSPKPSIEPSIEKGGGSSSVRSLAPAPVSSPPDYFPSEENPVRRDRCARHQFEDFPPPCGGCKDARVAFERQRAELDAEVEAQARAKAQARATAPPCPAHDWERSGSCSSCAGEHKGGEHAAAPVAWCRFCEVLGVDA